MKEFLRNALTNDKRNLNFRIFSNAAMWANLTNDIRRNQGGRLACLRLEDGREFYV